MSGDLGKARSIRDPPLLNQEVFKMATRGNPGRGDRGACGGTRKKDGSGGGVGNRNTPRQPKNGEGVRRKKEK